jgi:hypothetical protein
VQTETGSALDRDGFESGEVLSYPGFVSAARTEGAGHATDRYRQGTQHRPCVGLPVARELNAFIGMQSITSPDNCLIVKPSANSTASAQPSGARASTSRDRVSSSFNIGQALPRWLFLSPGIRADDPAAGAYHARAEG